MTFSTYAYVHSFNLNRTSISRVGIQLYFLLGLEVKAKEHCGNGIQTGLDLTLASVASLLLSNDLPCLETMLHCLPS